MFIQIGPSMCSISELMGKKNSKTTTTTTDYSKKTYSTKLGYIFHHQFPVPNTFYTRDPTNIFLSLGFIRVVVTTCE
jgi:hypothetical protein